LRLTDGSAFSELTLHPGGIVLAMRSGLCEPPAVVALDPAGGQPARVVHAIELPEPLPGQVREVRSQAADGTPLRAWLMLPPGPGPAPLVVTIHGGPLSSWNSWSWRWQPHLLAARGYAVLLPDPALSTGYGQHMIARGWDRWGGPPYDDVMALTDAALELPELDATRTAVAGGSYGGYLTNWVVGHTDRFRCAVTHAALWSMEQFAGTTDDAMYWRREWGDPRADAQSYREWSPDSYLDAVVTPTLVIHGEQDYRVPIGEGVRMWTDLVDRGVESRLLLFPDENHWIMRPGNVAVWYDAVLGWLDHYLLGEPLERPEHC
jgi:dipeptidyl aminopeptidase/acylaminoacyl peptidase